MRDQLLLQHQRISSMPVAGSHVISKSRAFSLG
jgi:hypothetical protein